MPVPTPKPTESQQEFIARCMGDPTMVTEYEQKQRAAICYRQWRESKTQQNKGAATARRST
jgi:hypothetical protein